MFGSMHREDVKAELRKRFGSVAAFERSRNLPAKSVNEILRGRKSARVADAIDDALNEPIPEACLTGAGSGR
jgi:lambda repressor-like predicted transcriptional regulator